MQSCFKSQRKGGLSVLILVYLLLQGCSKHESVRREIRNQMLAWGVARAAAGDRLGLQGLCRIGWRPRYPSNGALPVPCS